jgi:uncharacterized protein
MIKKTLLFWIFIFMIQGLSAQPKNKYGYPLSIVSDLEAYFTQIESDSNKALIEIKTCIPNIALDIRYATENNFLKKVFYKQAKAFARLPVVKALQKVQAELNPQGLGVKIYDGYRPYAVTVQFYESLPDSLYVASPWSGSKHNRGCALDMTLVDLKSGNELPMPTPFDTDNKNSWADAPVKDKKALKNREILKAVMAKNGFAVEPSEWWHYNFDGWRDYALMDIPFEILSKTPTRPKSANLQIKGDYPYKGVNFTAVQLQDNFWLPRMEINRVNTIPHSFGKCEETGRVKNFDMAAQHAGKFCTIYPFDDSDIYKTLEGAAYSLHTHYDPKLDKYCDSLIAIIQKAQEPDGYLYTARSIDSINGHAWMGKKRWEKENELSHELYNLGHLYEAAAAHFLATKKRNLLDIALKSADLVDNDFGIGKISIAPGHEVIEMGLVKLYRVTGEERFLKLAKFLIETRGKKQYVKESSDIWTNGSYWQDHKPVIEQTEATGHAVRATYLYTGMADVAALTGEQPYIEAINKIWDNAVGKKTYITGGIGAAGDGERFGKDYDLPNETAYAETCASIGNAYWNYRMFLLNGDAKYFDLLERIIYNGFLSGVSLDGKGFFYTNPMETNLRNGKPTGEFSRSSWFGCSCCPTNIARFYPSVSGYMYAQKSNDIYVNLFSSSTVKVQLDNGNNVELSQQTDYPWEGKVNLKINNFDKNDFVLRVRIPGYARNEAFPTDLYQFSERSTANTVIKINGQIVYFTLDKGYALLSKTWQKGDVVEVTIPMEVRRVVAHENVKSTTGKISILRGPLVYCAEFSDNNNRTSNLILPNNVTFTTEFQKDLLGGVMVIKSKAIAVNVDASGTKVTSQEQPFVAIPYYARCNRGEGEMRIWFPQKIVNVDLLGF